MARLCAWTNFVVVTRRRSGRYARFKAGAGPVTVWPRNLATLLLTVQNMTARS
jgi:hypothetical protein